MVEKSRFGLIYDHDYSKIVDNLPSNPNRSSIVHGLLKAYGIIDQLKEENCLIKPDLATIDDMIKFHDEDYINVLLGIDEESDLADFGLEEDCPLFEGIEDYCKYVIGGSLTSAKLLTSQKFDYVAFLDGGRHHGKYDKAVGFCYVNDIVLGIMELQSKYERILYIDLDIHHGDGVERAFLFSDKVFTLSFHQYAKGFFFPSTGSEQDIGKGKGLGHNLNVILKAGCNDETFLNVYKYTLEKCINLFKPNCLVIQCGSDGIVNDPLIKKTNMGWNLSVEFLKNCVLDTMKNYNLPIMFLGGGGYDNANVARCWTCLIYGIMNFVNDYKLKELDLIIPDHEFIDEYSKDNYDLIISSTCQKDENYENNYLNKLKERIKNHFDDYFCIS